MKRDFTYCKGIGCAIKESCVRYIDGLVAMQDEEQHWWMEDCGEYRDGYINSK